MKFSKTQTRLLLFVLSGALYVISLFLPGLLFELHSPLNGLYLLLWGWLGMTQHEFAWIANIVYFLGLLIYSADHGHFPKGVLVIAIALGLTSFHVKEWWFNEGSGTLITGFGAGYYLWISSFVVLLIGCFITPKNHK